MANITPRPLTVTSTGINKQYDGNTTTTVTLSDDRVAGDAVTDAYTSAGFADKNVGNGKAVSVSGITIGGTDSGNYALSNTTASTTADIAPRPLVINATGVNKDYDGNGGNNYLVTFHSVSTGTITRRTLVVTASGMNKIYDGTAVATVTLSDDRLTADTFTDSYAAANFANKNVGMSKAISVTGISLS